MPRWSYSDAIWLTLIRVPATTGRGRWLSMWVGRECATGMFRWYPTEPLGVGSEHKTGFGTSRVASNLGEYAGYVNFIGQVAARAPPPRAAIVRRETAMIGGVVR